MKRCNVRNGMGNMVAEKCSINGAARANELITLGQRNLRTARLLLDGGSIGDKEVRGGESNSSRQLHPGSW